MNVYSKVYATIFTRGSGKQLRGDPLAQVLTMYLMVCSHADQFTGIFYIGIPTIAHEVGATPAELKRAFARLKQVGIAEYDEETEMVWVPNMAHYQLGAVLKPGDKRKIWLLKALEGLKPHRFVNKYIERYRVPYGLDIEPEPDPCPKNDDSFSPESLDDDVGRVCPIDAPSMPHASPIGGASGGSRRQKRGTSQRNDATFDVSTRDVGEHLDLFRDYDNLQESASPSDAPSMPHASPIDEASLLTINPSLNPNTSCLTATEAKPPESDKSKRTRKTTAKTPLPQDWQPTPAHVELGKTLGFDTARMNLEAEKFRDRNASKGERYADWNAAFRNWLRNAQGFDDLNRQRVGVVPIRPNGKRIVQAMTPNTSDEYPAFSLAKA